MREIREMPVKSQNGMRIGTATIRFDPATSSSHACMVLDSELAKELIYQVTRGQVSAVSFGPYMVPARDASGDQPHYQSFSPEKPSTPTGQLGRDEIIDRFGFHKGTIEGPNATAPRHAEIRKLFVEFAATLDVLLPGGRAKEIAFERLEDASMWSHKAVASLAPVENE